MNETGAANPSAHTDSWLSSIGFNAAVLDKVPVGNITELEHLDEKTGRLMFKFTESDIEPFYGLLRAVSATSEGWLENEATKRQGQSPINITDLFNRPSETRGKPVLLNGTVKRIVPTPVSDQAVQSRFGIEHYYQVFLFPEGSRGNPIVVCVRSLPNDMPSGDGLYERVTVAAIPYKLWIYESHGGTHYAPLLIGRSLTWHPKISEGRRSPVEFASFSFAAFFALGVLWYVCRFWVWRRSMAVKKFT